MTKLFKNSKSVLSLVLAFAVLAVSLFTGVVINSDAASCKDDLSQLNVVYANGGIGQTAPTRGTGSETDPYIIENPSHLRYVAQMSTPATTYGKYYKVDDNVDIMVFQSEAYINAVAGSLEAFLALDAEGTKTALSNTENRIQFQSGTLAADYDSFAGTIDFNGVTICGIYNANGGLIAVANGGTTLKNLTLCNNYYTSGWYNGNIVGYVHNGTAGTDYSALTISNVVIHDCYQYTTGNGYGNTGVLVGTGINSKNISFNISNILTYDNISLGHTSGSDTTENACALYGTLPTSWSGESDGVANASYNNIVTLDCVPYPTQNINNQCTKPAFWSSVYTAKVDAQDREPCTWYQDGDQWSKFDITKLDSADLAKGAAAKTNMPKLDWVNTWITVDGAYPELQSMHSFAATDNGDGTHTTKCADCGYSLGTVDHNFVGGVCACGYEAKCGEVVLYWDGSADSTLADNGEAGTADNPIIIDSAAELNYLSNSVEGKSAAGKLYYKMADGIDYAILQPEGKLDVERLLACSGDEVYTYFNEIGLTNLVNWETKAQEMWFAGHFDGNGVTFAGMYSADNSAGLFATADGGAEFKNLAVVSSYIDGVAGNARTGAIVGGTCGVKYGAGVVGTVTFDTIMVANNYLHCYTNQSNGAIVMGACNNEDAVSINNAIVYGNASKYDNQGNTGLEDKTMHLYNGVNANSGTTISTVTNSIIFGTRPYYAWYDANMSGVDSLENVYTDQAANPYSQVEYAETDVKNIEGLAGAELKEACAALDWANTFLATADMPTFRAFHDAEFEASYNDETHSLTCSCGLAIEAAPHDWSNKDGVCAAGCGYECAHEQEPIFTPSSPADCTNPEYGTLACSVCGLEFATDVEGDVAPLGHDMKLVEGTPAKCGVAGVKDYYDCSRCDYVSEDEAGEVAIENLDEWKVIPALDHVADLDDQGKTIYAWDDTTPGMHYNVCDLCGEKYNGTTCTGEYVFDDEGHEGECTVCGIATAGKEAHSNFDENHKCGTCDWVCTNHVWVDDGEPVELGMEATDDACMTQAQKCDICGAAGENRIIAHELSEWQTNPRMPSTPACAGEGSHTEIRSCTVCYYSSASENFTRTVTDPKTGHAFDEFEASEPSCLYKGEVAHKYCPNCSYSFAMDAAEDEPYENALTDEELYIPADPEAHVWVEYAAGEADCENDGYSADHKFCSVCKAFVVDGEDTNIVLDYDKFYEAEYDEEGNLTPIGVGAIADVYATELMDEMFEQWLADQGIVLPEMPAEDADWEEWDAYYEEYYTIMDGVDTAEFEEMWNPILEEIWNEAYHQYFLAEAEAADLIEVEEALGHNIVKVDEVAATYEKEGVKAHYACKDCGTLYADAEGKTVVTEEELVIAKLVKEEKPADKPADTEGDKPAGDNGDKSPATGENVASVAAVAALMGAAFVLVRKARRG